jgi:two-component system, chemotaxis family, chemotaxis protein CheY
MRVLVIDDSRAVRMVIGRIMRELGFEVHEAGNGREGLEQLGRMERPDVILVDWNMPEVNGLEFIAAVRRNAAYEATPIIMVTTETEMNQVVRALETGASEYIMKPFTKDIILDKLAMLSVVPA